MTEEGLYLFSGKNIYCRCSRTNCSGKHLNSRDGLNRKHRILNDKEFNVTI
jgi:hypothetical protein